MQLIYNIGLLATLVKNDQSIVGEIKDAAILIDGENIFWCGHKKDQPHVEVDERLDACGKLVIPGLIDCHSHLLFSGTREHEFAARMRNETYQSIMKKGGGILSTVNATKHASDHDLLEQAMSRAHNIIALGVTTLEAKSGYGLSLRQELRALRLLKTLDENHALDIHRTFLGAHVIPKEYGQNRTRYVSLIIDEMLEQVANEQLASDCDVFCDVGAFTVDESRQILLRAHELGLGLRAHLHQLSNNGGVALVRELPIKSISHADYLGDDDMAMIAKSDTVVEALPIAALFLRSSQITPVEALLKASVSLAIATDFNPGSAMCHDLVLAARLGVTLFRFPVEEALRAITVNAAKSIGRLDIGAIDVGRMADLVITNCLNIEEFFYDWTKHPVATVVKRGKVVRWLPACASDLHG